MLQLLNLQTLSQSMLQFVLVILKNLAWKKIPCKGFFIAIATKTGIIGISAPTPTPDAPAKPSLENPAMKSDAAFPIPAPTITPYPLTHQIIRTSKNKM